ncbi:PSD2, partial [Symbiodinium sp. CCMP2456]
ECLRKLGEESNLTQFLGDGTSQKMVKDMCIFLYEVGDEPGAAGTWYLENVPTEVRGLLKTAYGGGSFTGFLFRTLLTVEDNLQNVGFGSGLVKKANKVTSKYDQKGVMAYETKDLEKKLHYIRHFVETYKVDLEGVEGLQGCGNEDACIAKAGEIFPTYNHFFYRKLALGSRKMLCYSQDAGECQEIDENARATKSLVSPADGRVIVFPDFIPEKTGFWVKGEQFLLQSLVSFKRDSDYRYYDHGVAFIVRLAPQDYHRFHFPVDGVVKSFENYPGNYYSVNPIAVQSTDPVFTTNKRMHVTLDTGEDNLGCVTYVSVGATNVGSVMHTSYVGQEVLRGMEHGYMAFGGSTVLVFVRRGVLDVVDPI